MLSLPPLALYVHFPWCIQKCPYCDFNSHTLRDTLPESAYIKTLIEDLSQELHSVQERKLTSIYLGGGTPSLLSGPSIYNLLKEIKKRVALAENIEITLEANPNSIDLNHFKHYRESGVNRLSIGVQSFHSKYLKKLGRTHNSDDAKQAILTAKSVGFTNFNIDLMYGLPDQTLHEGLLDLKCALQFNPPHLSWYQLTLEPHTEFFYRPPSLPSDELVIDLEQKSYNYLKEFNLNRYEISAFSAPGLECKHNCNYWQFGDYIGIGPGASSKITNLHCNQIIRYRKASHPNIYLKKKGYLRQDIKVLDKKDLIFEFMLNTLRYYHPISKTLFESRTGLPFNVLSSKVEQAICKRLLIWDQQGIQVTALGKRFYNDLVTLFL